MFKFPYAGSEEKPKMVVRVPQPSRREIRPSQASHEKVDIRPIDVPKMSDVLRQMLIEVAKKHNIHPNDLVGEGRSVKLIAARREFIWRCRKETTASFPRIGRALNRDHTTAIYHYQHHAAQLARKDKKTVVWDTTPPSNSDTELSGRQEYIRGRLLRGYTNSEIAAEMGVSVSLVKQDRCAIKRIRPIPVKP